MLAVGARGLGPKTWCVRSRLRSKLSEVHVGTSAVAEVHGLCQATLGVVAVEDNAVKGDGDDFDNDLDDDTDQSPVLKTAEKRIVDVVLVDCGTSVADARPSPHVLVIVAVL